MDEQHQDELDGGEDQVNRGGRDGAIFHPYVRRDRAGEVPDASCRRCCSA
jgi:hypothetical protein